jgi:hypothetical protein
MTKQGAKCIYSLEDNLALGFTSPKDYSFALGRLDKDNVEQLVKSIQKYEHKAYLSGQIPKLILENKLPREDLPRVYYETPYEEIELFAQSKDLNNVKELIYLFEKNIGVDRKQRIFFNDIYDKNLFEVKEVFPKIFGEYKARCSYELSWFEHSAISYLSGQGPKNITISIFKELE